MAVNHFIVFAAVATWVRRGFTHKPQRTQRSGSIGICRNVSFLQWAQTYPRPKVLFAAAAKTVHGL